MTTTYSVDLDMMHYTTEDPVEAEAYSDVGARVTARTEVEA